MSQTERDELLAAVLMAISNGLENIRHDTPSADAFNALSEKVGGLEKRFDAASVDIEEIRRNSKGANNWGKIAAAVAGVAAPVVTAAVTAYLRTHGVY